MRRAQGTRSTKPRARWIQWAPTAVLMLATLVAWQLVTRGNLVDPFFLPSPKSTAAALRDSLGSAEFWGDLRDSLYRVAVGFLMAVAAAVPGGLWMGRNRAVERFVLPPIAFVRFVPMPATIPLFILWFGSGDLAKALIISLGVFFQLIIMIADVAKNVPKEYEELAITLKASRWQWCRHFLLPACAPGVWDSLRTNLGLAWATLVFAEMLGATSGLGYAIVKNQRYLLIARVFVIIAVIGLLGVLADFSMNRLGRRLFPWAAQQLD